MEYATQSFCNARQRALRWLWTAQQLLSERLTPHQLFRNILRGWATCLQLWIVKVLCTDKWA